MASAICMQLTNSEYPIVESRFDMLTELRSNLYEKKDIIAALLLLIILLLWMLSSQYPLIFLHLYCKTVPIIVQMIQRPVKLLMLRSWKLSTSFGSQYAPHLLPFLRHSRYFRITNKWKRKKKKYKYKYPEEQRRVMSRKGDVIMPLVSGNIAFNSK